MIGIVVISHGGMADGMMTSAPMLWSNCEQMTSLTLWPSDNAETFGEKLTAKIAEVDSGEGVFVLTDLAGGTPCNQALYKLIAGEHIQLLTGVNLPMLLTLLAEREDCTELSELAALVLEEAAHGMSDLGQKMKDKGLLQ